MKKHTAIIILLAMLISAAGCSSDNNTGGSNTESIDENKPYGAQSENYIVAIDEAPETAFIDGDTELSSTYPIYVNEYAYGQEGPLFEIDDEAIGMMTNNLSQFLVLLYGESIAETCDIVKNPEVEQGLAWQSQNN